MKRNQCQIFKYKGKVFMLNEVPLSKKIKGCRMPVDGIEVIAINKNLSKRERMLLIHRLVTGRGIRGIAQLLK